MSRRFSVIAVRRLLIAKCFAALLIALTLTPFTAPFSTIDIAEIVGDRPLNSNIKTGPKASPDESDFCALTPSELFAEVFTLFESVRLSHLTDTRHVRSVVLRI
jgi:hypothetical protein